MATNKYVGSRYVPKYFGTWNAATAYEALSIVSDAEGVYTYTSKRPVPAGTSVSNTAYWAQSGTLSESMQMGTISHVDSTKADDANIAANKLNITFASDYTMNDATERTLNLNETVQSGTYGINPSLCQNAPSELSTSADTCQLYVYVLNVNNYTQTLVCPKKGTQYVRINDGTGWSDWQLTSGETYTPTYATKQGAGLVQLGDGLKAENATGLTTIDHDASLAIDGQNKIGVVAATAEQLGGVKIGSGLAVTPEGVASVKPATSSTLGGIIIGNGLTVDDSGLLSASGSSGEWKNIKPDITISKGVVQRAAVNETLKLCYLSLSLSVDGSSTGIHNYAEVNSPLRISGIPATPYIGIATSDFCSAWTAGQSYGAGIVHLRVSNNYSTMKASAYVSSLCILQPATAGGYFFGPEITLFYPIGLN